MNLIERILHDFLLEKVELNELRKYFDKGYFAHFGNKDFQLKILSSISLEGSIPLGIYGFPLEENYIKWLRKQHLFRHWTDDREFIHIFKIKKQRILETKDYTESKLIRDINMLKKYEGLKSHIFTKQKTAFQTLKWFIDKNLRKNNGETRKQVYLYLGYKAINDTVGELTGDFKKQIVILDPSIIVFNKTIINPYF